MSSNFTKKIGAKNGSIYTLQTPPPQNQPFGVSSQTDFNAYAENVLSPLVISMGTTDGTLSTIKSMDTDGESYPSSR